MILTAAAAVPLALAACSDAADRAAGTGSAAVSPSAPARAGGQSEGTGEKVGEIDLPPGFGRDPETGEWRGRIHPRGGTQATVRSGPAVPIDLPAGLAPYPGARIVSNTVARRDGARRVLLDMTTADPVPRVMAHYRAQARAAGARITLDIGAADRASLAGVIAGPATGGGAPRARVGVGVGVGAGARVGDRVGVGAGVGAGARVGDRVGAGDAGGDGAGHIVAITARRTERSGDAATAIALSVQ